MAYEIATRIKGNPIAAPKISSPVNPLKAPINFLIPKAITVNAKAINIVVNN